MKKCIFKSKEMFQFLDYSISHGKLLLRATVIDRKEEKHHNIDIVFVATYFFQTVTYFVGLKILLGDKDAIILMPDGNEICLKAKEHYILVSNKKKYYIGAMAVNITENILDSNQTSLKKY
jgi:hypothetical protein